VRPSKDTFTIAVEDAIAGEDYTITRDGVPIAVLVGVERYDELTAALDDLSGEAEPRSASSRRGNE